MFDSVFQSIHIPELLSPPKSQPCSISLFPHNNWKWEKSIEVYYFLGYAVCTRKKLRAFVSLADSPTVTSSSLWTHIKAIIIIIIIVINNNTTIATEHSSPSFLSARSTERSTLFPAKRNSPTTESKSIVSKENNHITIQFHIFVHEQIELLYLEKKTKRLVSKSQSIKFP